MSYMQGRFCFCHLTGNVAISNNCRTQIYKSYMPGHYSFCHMIVVDKLTNLYIWACGHQSSRPRRNKSPNNKVNYLSKYCLYVEKERLAAWFWILHGHFSFCHLIAVHKFTNLYIWACKHQSSRPRSHKVLIIKLTT